MLKSIFDLDMTPNRTLPLIVNVSQYDDIGRTLVFNLFSSSGKWTAPTSAAVTFEGGKPDGKFFAYNCAYSNGTVTVTIQQQMTAVAGKVRCKIKVKSGDKVVESAPIIMVVDAAAVPDGSDMSKSDINDAIANATQKIVDQVKDSIPSDYAQLSTDVSSLKQDLGSQNTIFNGALFDYKYNLLAGRIWAHGSWASSKPTDVKNRIRTGIINIDGLPNTFFVKVADGYLWNYYAFNGAYIGAGNEWKKTGYFKLSQHGNPTQISVLIKREDDAEITDITNTASKIKIKFELFNSFYKDLRMIKNGALSDYNNAEGFYGCNASNISNITDLPSNISTGFILRNEQIKLSDTSVFGTFQTVQSRHGEIATRFITTSNVADDWTVLRTKSIEMVSIGDSIPLGTYSWFDESAQWGHLSAVDTKISYVQKMCNIKGIVNRNYCHGGLGWLRTANDETSLKPLLDTIDFTSVNYVYIQLGTNDWNYSFTLGSVEDAKDSDTVCGNIRYAIEYIYDKNPIIKLCVALPFNRAPGGASYKYNWGYGAMNSQSKTLKDYCDVIKNICDEYGVQYIDWTTNSAIGRLNIQKMLPDGTHPSVKAHEILAHELAGRIPFN
jgi:lysophospholipase L1-like esterase